MCFHNKFFGKKLLSAIYCHWGDFLLLGRFTAALSPVVDCLYEDGIGAFKAVNLEIRIAIDHLYNRLSEHAIYPPKSRVTAQSVTSRHWPHYQVVGTMVALGL